METTLALGNIQNVYIISNSTIINSPLGAAEAIHYTTSIPGGIQNNDPKSINNVAQVTVDFIESEAYRRAKQITQQESKVTVLHLFGIPGSGKSEIVRKLAANFPEDDEEVFVKMHIECNDQNHDIQKQLEKLLDLMVKHRMLVMSDGVAESAKENLIRNRSQQYVGLLTSVDFPILIIIEDPSDNSRGLMEDFLSCVGGLKNRTKKFHIYVTSQSSDTLKLPRSDAFRVQEVVGLTIDEGFSVLGVNDEDAEDEKLAAKRIIERLSCSPLGLRAVKEAKTDAITFKMYLKYLEDDSLVHSVINNEERQLNVNHLHKSILILLEPNSQNEDALKRWKVISSLALLHHGNIPQSLIGRIMQYLRDGEETIQKADYLNRFDSGKLIDKFRKCGLCKVTGNAYMTTKVTFHEVVFIAIRLHLGESGEIVSAVRPAIKATSSLVHKDLRMSGIYDFMYEMVPHMQSILKHQATDSDNILLKFCCGHLYEVIGVVLSTKQNANETVSSAERNLKNALSVWINIMRSLNNSDISLELVAIPTYEDLTDRVKFIVDQCTEAGRNLMVMDFDIEEFISIVLQLKCDDMEYYCTISSDEVVAHLRGSLENNISLHPSKLHLFRSMNTKLFLNRTTLFETYFAERVASILHTMSRLIVYNNGLITLEDRKRFTWFSSLALAICNEVQIRYGVAPIFLRLAVTGLVGNRLKDLDNFSATEKLNGLLETKRFVQEKLLNKESFATLFYEHGISKQVGKHEFEFLTHARLLVRINAKLISLGCENSINVDEADDLCRTLHQKATSNMDWNVSVKIIVFCGKYWASKKDYAKAVEHFEEALGCEGIRSPSEVTRSFPWACYNHARAVVRGKLVEFAAASKSHCEKALEQKDVTARKLVVKLGEIVAQLDGLLAESATALRETA